MRKTWQAVAVVAALAAGGASAQAPGSAKAGAPKAAAPKAAGKADAGPSGAELEETLYGLGAFLGRNVEDFQLTPRELETVKRGFSDQVAGKAGVDLAAMGPKLQALAAARRQAANAAFLDRKAKDKGAKKTASGLVYTELVAGKGRSPRPSDTVQVHYRGTLPDGREFDSSFKRGPDQPVQFPLNGVIPCWTEGVGMMKVGGKARLVCPPGLAYGDRAPPGSIIPPNSPLEFEVELLDITTDPKQ